MHTVYQWQRDLDKYYVVALCQWYMSVAPNDIPWKAYVPLAFPKNLSVFLPRLVMIYGKPIFIVRIKVINQYIWVELVLYCTNEGLIDLQGWNPVEGWNPWMFSSGLASLRRGEPNLLWHLGIGRSSQSWVFRRAAKWWTNWNWSQTRSGWWFGTWLFIFPYIGNDNPKWLIYFQRGWNHQAAFQRNSPANAWWFQLGPVRRRFLKPACAFYN